MSLWIRAGGKTLSSGQRLAHSNGCRIAASLLMLTAAACQAGTYYSTVVSNDAPVVYWNFDEDSGNALQQMPILPDGSTDNDLVSVNDVGRYEQTALQLGRAADFTGANWMTVQQLNTGMDSAGATWAVEYWMQVQGANSGTRQNYLANFGSAQFIYDYVPFELEVYNGSRTTSTPTVTDTNWHHVLWVYYGDGNAGVANRMDVFLDGVQYARIRGNFSGSVTLNNSAVVGAATQDGANKFEGRLDELAVYNWSSFTSEADVEAKADSMVAAHRAAALGAPEPVITITQQPAGATVDRGNSYTFSVAATVSNAPQSSLQYQWLRNGALIASATNSAYTTPVLGLNDYGTNNYQVLLTALSANKLSEAALLVVPAPANPAATEYSSSVLADNPVLYWNFDEWVGNAQQLAPVDASLSNDNNALQPTAGAGRIQHSTLNDGLNLGNAAELGVGYPWYTPALQTGRQMLLPPWAVEFWIQVQGNNTIGSGDRQNYLLKVSGDQPSFIYDFKPDQLEMWEAGNYRTDGGPTVTDTNWHYVVWVFYGDGSYGVTDRASCWVDGQLQSATSVRNTFYTSFNLASSFIVGSATYGPQNGFQGRMDEVAVYDLSSLADESSITSYVSAMAQRHLAAAMTFPATLGIQSTGSGVRLSWSGTGYTLQQRSNLDPSSSWTDVASATNSPVTIAPATGATMFYRLRK